MCLTSVSGGVEPLEMINCVEMNICLVQCPKKNAMEETKSVFFSCSLAVNNFSSETRATGYNAELLRNVQDIFNECRSNSALFERIRRSDPQMAEAIDRNNPDAFIQCMMNRTAPRRTTHQTEVDLLDPGIQERIEETIKMENILDNMEHAYEHAPEFFGSVVMLYINCKVNGHAVKAFVDSGAQMTIMSKACAERCEILRLIDRRFSGIAKGVGTQEILGRIHLAQLQVENQIFATSLSVLADQSMDMLIGLDMLRRHRCVIDLQKNVLRIENLVETRFLPESDLPEHARQSDSSSSAPKNDASQGLLPSTSDAVDHHRQSQSRQSASGPSPFPDKAIQQIMKRGFTREQAIEELKLTNGDVTKALVSIMTKSLSKPQPKK